MSNILQDIFQDYYEEMIYTLHPRQSVIENVDRTTSISFKILNRTLLNCLFSAVSSVVLRMFRKINKSEAFTLGFICVLHTFGRDLKWHPHIHCLISEVGIGNSGRWRSVNHFNYKLLRDSFQTALLNELHARLGDSFKKTKAACYRNHKNGFYVYAKPNKCAPGVVAKYIGRYLGRPVIATSRIDNYDGESVTFHYNRHEDNAYVQETIPALEFIERLIQHIPEKHSILLSFNRRRECTLLSFGYDPLQCPRLAFTVSSNCDTINLLNLEDNHMAKQHTEELIQKYILNPPEDMTADEIRTMSEDDLLDMDYFLNEDDLFDDEAGVAGFYIF